MLGADPDRIRQTGSAKYDVALKNPGNPQESSAILATAMMSAEDLILLGGSTWSGEEDILLDYFLTAKTVHPRLKLVLVPRHAERRDEVVAAIKKRRLRYVQRSLGHSAVVAGEMPPDVLLVDTTGELRHLYTQAAVIFVGKSLTQHGGQNIIEPGVCGKAIVVGPNMENFLDIVAEFSAAQALIQVPDTTRLRNSLDTLLFDKGRRDEIGARAAALVESNRGSLRTTVVEAGCLLSGRGSA